ncbi:MAG TPA: NADH-quinone oxidoreductase subunit NuoF [Victivallales bacterium]|nr:NADH-quinone oxidoreductase subunit NuoF [Victivallales bacterium]
MIENYQDLSKYSQQLVSIDEKKPSLRILVSLGTCGLAAGTTPVLDAIVDEIKNKKLENKIEIIETGCMGLCYCEPSIELFDKKSGKSIIYGNVKPENASAIIAAGVDKPAEKIDVINRTWYYPEEETNVNNVSQAKIALRNTGRINPEKIDDYILNSGYNALARAINKMTSQEVIDEITKSGLRGRGGGGFPTGRKWSFAAAQKTDVKYIICNADEGDPGAFMDRAVLEGDPHTVLESMTIAGYAIDATKGYIYIRAEYPLAIKRLQLAIEQSREKGFLGENIFNSGFSFDIELRYGAGAFVCGEETALIHSIEGQRGMPSNKPPFPAIEGLWKKPTIVNNVETFANIGAILRKGADWFNQIGTENSSGTKVFALAGKISKVGLIEVPMGIKLRDIIYDIGGGIDGGKEFKAVQTGGPSGGCIVPEYLDTPIDYDSLKALGSMMGSGGMIVMDEDDCMVDIAKFFLDFTVDESCGKCIPCRLGGKQLYKILNRITEGDSSEEDLALLTELSHTVKDTSLCGLGMTAPNPVLSTMRYFEDEYREHILEKKCRAGKCTKLITYSIDDKCIGCTACAKVCPVNCIEGKVKQLHVIDEEKCIRCGECFRVCKFKAVVKS